MSSSVRAWRTAFLTLRDETSSSPTGPTVLHLLNHLILSQSDYLIDAAPNLPSHEVTSDLMLLLELAHSISLSKGDEDDDTLSFINLSHLIYGVSHGAFLPMNPTSWALAFDAFKSILQTFVEKLNSESASVEIDAVIKATRQCVESIRHLFVKYQTAASLSENEQLLSLLLQVVGCFHGEFMCVSYLSDNQKVSGFNSVLEILRVVFSMIGEVYSRVGSCLPVEIWQSTIEVLRKTLDIITSKNLLLKDDYAAMFYIELLNCLHLVLTAPRGCLTGHVSGLAAALRSFFRYGLINKSGVVNNGAIYKDTIGSTSQNPHPARSSKSRNGPYKPPHLRKKQLEIVQQKDEDSPEDNSSSVYIASSDSDTSDADGSATDKCSVLYAKTRLAAITCIQDLCRADPKLFTAQWTLLLPSTDVLQHRQYETTLMSCFLLDPNSKVRIASGSTITAMLDGPTSVSLQVAEFREPAKCGSFTSLSSSLGYILMQLHAGTLHLIRHENHSRLLALSFKILMLLTSSTPYSRMPPDLLSTVISTVTSRIEEGFVFQSDRNGLVAAAINCLTLALSVSPSLTYVNNMLLTELSTGSLEGQQKAGALYTLFRYSEQQSSPLISLEAFQALKALAHNYPNVMALCWDKISSIVKGAVSGSAENAVRSWRDNVEHNTAAMKERVMTAAIKVLDECLRAISGFKGTEDNSNDKLMDSPFTSDYVKEKAISSAPSYTLKTHAPTNDESDSCTLASQRWLEATVKHIPPTLKHSSPIVRAASVTCFAGMTSSVFSLLPKDKQDFIICSSIDALSDKVPSVRSAACRTIGVIACFAQIYQSTDILEKFINAAEQNSRDSLLSVRITASWASANICDSLGRNTSAQHSESRKNYRLISKLVQSALRLAKDNDKVKANAVRALGNLSRFVQFTSDSSSVNADWLVNMVQAFLSCVATGNVKVQWNVCHALSNLFSNRTLKLEEMEWASSLFSILLLLLRDSSNFKIKIQAAAALAVPETINDYGRSYYDVVKGVENMVENFKSDQISEPSNFKYRVALEKQLTSSMLHLLGLAGRSNHRALQEFLTKKASFLEVWIKNICTSLIDNSDLVDECKHSAINNKKKEIIHGTIRSLIDVYESCNQHSVAQQFNRFAIILL